MRTTKTISKVVDICVDECESNNWSKFDWKLQISKEIDVLVKQAKAEAWDECYKVTFDYCKDCEIHNLNDEIGVDNTKPFPSKPINPYKV